MQEWPPGEASPSSAPSSDDLQRQLQALSLRCADQTAQHSTLSAQLADAERREAVLQERVGALQQQLERAQVCVYVCVCVLGEAGEVRGASRVRSCVCMAGSPADCTSTPHLPSSPMLPVQAGGGGQQQQQQLAALSRQCEGLRQERDALRTILEAKVRVLVDEIAKSVTELPAEVGGRAGRLKGLWAGGVVVVGGGGELAA